MWGIWVYAFRRGGWAERLAATGIILNSYLTLLLVSPSTIWYQHVEVGVAAVDCALLLLLGAIALISDKFWPLWLTAMQGLTMFAHAAPYVPHILPWSYYNASALWMYPMLILLGFSVRRHGAGRKSRDSANYPTA